MGVCGSMRVQAMVHSQGRAQACKAHKEYDLKLLSPRMYVITEYPAQLRKKRSKTFWRSKTHMENT